MYGGHELHAPASISSWPWAWELMLPMGMEPMLELMLELMLAMAMELMLPWS